MKKRLIPIILYLFLVSCEKPSHEYGIASATVNGTEWTARSSGHLRFDKIYMRFERAEREEYLTSLIMGNLSKNFEKHTLSPLYKLNLQDSIMNHSYFESFNYYDPYEIQESDSDNNWVKINKQKNDFNEVWGEFSATYVRVGVGKLKSFYPDTVRFRNGTFHIKGLNTKR